MWKILVLLLFTSCAHKPTLDEIYFERLKDLTSSIPVSDKRDLSLFMRGFYEGCQVTLHIFTYDYAMKDKGIKPHCLKKSEEAILEILKNHPLNNSHLINTTSEQIKVYLR